METIGSKVLMFVALIFLFGTIVVAVLYPMITQKTNDVKTQVDSTAVSYVLPIEELTSSSFHLNV